VSVATCVPCSSASITLLAPLCAIDHVPLLSITGIAQHRIVSEQQTVEVNSET